MTARRSINDWVYKRRIKFLDVTSAILRITFIIVIICTRRRRLEYLAFLSHDIFAKRRSNDITFILLLTDQNAHERNDTNIISPSYIIIIIIIQTIFTIKRENPILYGAYFVLDHFRDFPNLQPRVFIA